MGETSKQVRVDNWGIFFLQRLQIFFNKTDYCDLTLQFEGNVQLKVHRLVMNACTDYFNVLEQSCEVVDGNILIMPHDLQADVILPIVNFMYTGMLEFQMSIFDRLYNTAALMDIPVLMKLLDAQKKPIAPLQKLANKKQSTWNLHGKKITPKVENDLPATLPGRKLPVWKRKSVPTPTQHLMVPHYHQETKRVPQDPLATFDNTPKPTRFEWPEDEINSTFNLMDNSFDDISYTSKPLLTQEDELRASTSFDEIKQHTSTTHKKPKDLSNQSIDMEEVKNYVKEQKIRSDLVEYEDEDDPDNYLEHVIPDKAEGGLKRKGDKSASPTSKRVRFSINEKENKETKINVTPSGKMSDMNHTKIISEVLRKYPHLVKKNKNIRLKILAKSPVKAKPETQKAQQAVRTTSKLRVQVSTSKGLDVNLSEPIKNQDEGPWVCSKCSTPSEMVEFVLYYLYRKHMTDVHNEKFDSRMCKFCGHQSNKHNMLMYHQYTRHGIKPPPAYNFPKCNRCPYIALTENLLIKHKLNHTKFDLQCTECKVAFNSQGSLASHIQITGHTGKSGRNSYDCQYCTKRYHTGSNLFSHIKLSHRNEARRDGIVSIDESEDLEDEQAEEEADEYIVPEIQEGKEKIKIISNIKVPSSESETETQAAQHEQPPLESSVESDSLSNVTSGIATSLGLVDIVVLDENQQYILHNDQQLVTQQSLTNNQPEYILPEISSDQQSFPQAQNITEVITSEHNVITQGMLNNSDIASTDELVMVLTDHDYNDGNSEMLTNENSNIVVLYSHPVSGEQNQFITSQGNLMLNSQTGLLELRNSAPETDAEGHETQIESIEMIQREINSHNSVITGPEEPIKSDLVHICTSTATTAAIVQPLTQSMEILEENHLSGDRENVELSEREVTVEMNSEGVGHAEELISTTHDPEMVDSPQAEMEDETMHVTGDTEEQNLHDESMEIDEECASMENTQQVHTDAEKLDQESATAEHPDETFAEDMEIQTEQNHDVDAEQADPPADDGIQDDPENVADFPEGGGTNDSTSEQAEVTEETEQLATINDTEEEKECAEIATEVSDVANDEQQIIDADAAADGDGKNTEANHEEEEEEAEVQQKELDDDLQPPVLSPQIGINRTETEQQNCSQSPVLHPEVDAGETEEGNIEALQETEQDIIEQPQDSYTTVETDEAAQEQAPKELEEHNAGAVVIDDSEGGKVQNDDEMMSQNTDENSQNQVLSESGEENAKGDEVVDIENDNSETIDDDNSQSQDSQLSQSSQDSSKQENEKPVLKRNPCHTTKISILDDWEDTSSQQSDSNGKKAEITVNKLIHDWDDDEEEDDEDECHMEDT